MKPLTIETLSALVRTGSVHRVFLTPYPAIDGGGWILDVDHADYGQTRQLHTKRGGVRVFKAADAAIRALHECSYVGPLAVVGVVNIEAEQEAEAERYTEDDAPSP